MALQTVDWQKEATIFSCLKIKVWNGKKVILQGKTR